MRLDPRVVEWLRAERRGFWIAHGGALAAATLVWAAGACGFVTVILAVWGDVADVGMPVESRGARYLVMAALMLGAILAGGLIALYKWGAWLVREGRPLLRLDVFGCARIVAELLGEPMKLSYRELDRRLPDVRVYQLADQLAHLQGVVRFESPPALSITDKLRHRLFAQGAA